MALVLCRSLTRSRYSVEHTCIILQKFYSNNKPEIKPKSDGSNYDKPKFDTSNHDKPKIDTSFPINKSIADEKSSSSEAPSSSQPLAKPSLSSSARNYNPQKMREKVQGYFFTRFIDYLKNYDKVLEKKFPGAMKAYHVFMNGVKSFYQDMVALLKIHKVMLGSTQGLSTLTRKELELYYQMPRDMRKVGPLLLVSALPLAHYVILPVAYMYPRQILTSHFWTLQQRNEFAIISIKERISYNRKVFRFLQSKLPVLKNDKNYEQWRHILGLLGSGTHPTVQEVLDIKSLFAEPPYHQRSLPYTHVKNLCGLHGLMKGICIKSRLAHRANCFHHMDKAIKREGDVHNMPIDALRNACFLRGLNAANLPNADLIEWLEKWVEISMGIDHTNFSLYLHLPVLITYNHPNNWQLLYKNR